MKKLSEKKKQVIHVKDLVIKADHVTLEPPERRVDPFFGPRRPVGRDEQGVEKREENEEEPLNENRVHPFFGFFGRTRDDANPEERRQRDFDPILGRPIKREEEASESEETEEESNSDDK